MAVIIDQHSLQNLLYNIFLNKDIPENVKFNNVLWQDGLKFPIRDQFSFMNVKSDNQA